MAEPAWSADRLVPASPSGSAGREANWEIVFSVLRFDRLNVLKFLEQAQGTEVFRGTLNFVC